jgi:hypothetical protein
MISLIEQVEPVHDLKDQYGKDAAGKRGCQEYESLTERDHLASLQTISESAINTTVPKKILTLAPRLPPTLPGSHVQAKPQDRQLNQNCGYTETRGIVAQSTPYWVASEKRSRNTQAQDASINPKLQHLPREAFPTSATLQHGNRKKR